MTWGGGSRKLYLTLLCHHQNDSCIKTGSDESHFNREGHGHKVIMYVHRSQPLKSGKDRMATAQSAHKPSNPERRWFSLGFERSVDLTGPIRGDRDKTMPSKSKRFVGGGGAEEEQSGILEVGA